MAEQVLPVALMAQEQTSWCWAAVASAVSALRHGGAHPRQCEIAALVLHTANCCSHPHLNNVTARLQDALRAVNVPAALQPSDMLSPQLVFGQIVERQAPIGARILDSTNGQAHFVLLIGCDPATQDVVCADPWGAVGTPAPRYRMPLMKMQNDYGGWGVCTDICLLS